MASWEAKTHRQVRRGESWLSKNKTLIRNGVGIYGGLLRGFDYVMGLFTTPDVFDDMVLPCGTVTDLGHTQSSVTLQIFSILIPLLILLPM